MIRKSAFSITSKIANFNHILRWSLKLRAIEFRREFHFLIVQIVISKHSMKLPTNNITLASPKCPSPFITLIDGTKINHVCYLSLSHIFRLLITIFDCSLPLCCRLRIDHQTLLHRTPTTSTRQNGRAKHKSMMK